MRPLLFMITITGLFALSCSATDCRTEQVISGDTCTSLASKCGISGADFIQYNPSPNLCSSLSVGQHVCCSAGTLPSFSPGPQPDGTCATHTVVTGEYCSLIAATYGLTIDQLESYNNDTWGWMGCDDIAANFVMCISSGSPPMPANLPSAVCGPQVNGTIKPADMSSLWQLNPCSLNACCDIWGQCGTTSEFCTMTESITGAPGTASKGTNGCISNCGTKIINNADPPSEYRRIGYFESWNTQRPCLTMAPVDIQPGKYTHIHFAFGAIDQGSWTVNVSETKESFDQFVGLTEIWRVLSFGGWAFSTDPSTYAIFREAVSDDNYQTFATNVVNFAIEYSLNGLDFDWEYPGELDIPGIPPSSTVDSSGYLRFLNAVRSKLPASKSLSVAAPASYWYLKGFPISNISETVNYIVFMTYDLHGQWDYQNHFADPGCPSGGCLRSHVNLTETVNALSMITKAGVIANKVVVGVSSYGRSFQMSTAGCTGPMCTFTGPKSGAIPGRCTKASGYLSNAEIDEIASDDASTKSWYDQSSDSTIMTWKETQWVAYMDNTTRASRQTYYQNLNFGGWVEWAIDLESFGEGNANDTEPPIPPCDDCWEPTYPPCNGQYHTLEAINDDLDIIPVYCVDAYQISVLSTTLNAAFDNYSSLMEDGYDKKFGVYSKQIKAAAPTYLRKFINENANKYFDCKIIDGDGSPGCPTLPDLTNWNGQEAGIGNFSFKDEDGFYKALGKQYGIERSWTSIGEYKDVFCNLHVGCSHIDYSGVPQMVNSYDVPDPKKIITSALGKLGTLREILTEAAINSKNILYFSATDGDASTMGDTVNGASLPVFMMHSAILSMDHVVEVAHEANEDRIKEIILGFIGAVLFIVPGIGDALEAVDIALISSLGRLISLAGDVGNVAFDVYGAIEDPSNAIFAVFDGLSVARSFVKAADAVKLMKASEIVGMGETVQDGMAKVKKGCRSCI